MFFVEETFGRKIRDSIAIFSEPDPEAGRPLYRYFLGRTWDWKLQRLYVVMVNPSSADADADDPTISRLTAFARRWGYGGLGVVNLFALISTDPKGLDSHPNPEGPENGGYLDHVFHMARKQGTPMLAAWGNNGGRLCADRRFAQRAKAIEGVQLVCLGLTQHGHPKHPLARGEHRIPDDFEPIPFEPPWWGSVEIAPHLTVPRRSDGQPACGRCDGTAKSPTVLEYRSTGDHVSTDICGLCGGTGVHPNPFGGPDAA